MFCLICLKYFILLFIETQFENRSSQLKDNELLTLNFFEWLTFFKVIFNSKYGLFLNANFVINDL